MLKVSHMRIARETLNKIESHIDWKINRKAYILGSIIPDLNCAFPTHTINNTLNRFRKRLIRMDNTGSNFIKSFTLGIITHYICDYFCYAHNLNFPNPKHAVYERVMRAHIRKHEEVIGNWGDDLVKQWELIKEHTIVLIKENDNINSIEDTILRIQYDSKDHVEYIIDTVKDMHKKYISQTIDLDALSWYKSLNKIQLDIDYATFMCERIALLILAPNIEMVGNV